MSEPTGWRALIPELSDQDARLLAQCEAAGSSQSELQEMAQSAALERRFQGDCDRLYAESTSPVVGVEYSEWWPPGEGHEVTYRYVTLSNHNVLRPLIVQVLTEVEITGAVSPMRIEMTIDEVIPGLSPQLATVRLAPQDARDAAACLIAAAERIEAAA